MCPAKVDTAAVLYWQNCGGVYVVNVPFWFPVEKDCGEFGLTKIGMSSNISARVNGFKADPTLQKRLRSDERFSLLDLSSAELAHTIPCADKATAKVVEAAMHRLFWHRHVWGEWFQLSRDETETIQDLDCPAYVVGLASEHIAQLAR